MCQTHKQIQSKAPKRPYKNFAEFCLRHISAERVARGKCPCPCLVCFACGWQYHPDRQTVLCDGNRQREQIKCQACEGTGRGTKKVCFAKYKEILDCWEVAITIFKANVARRQRALAKLTESEIEALKALGL